MTTEEKFNLIKRNLDEVLTEEELKHLIESDTPLKHYIGFEISGKLHIGHFFQLLKVKDIQDAGGETIIWLADLHSAVNDKLGGNLEVIKKVSRDYFEPAMRVLFECIGGDPEKLIFKLCSEEYAKHPEFWMTFIEVGKATTLSRTKRSITIMGREEGDDSIETAKLMYPMMQAADIFLLQANIAQAGMDQRKVHVVARDAAHQIKTFPLQDKDGKQIKPVAIHTPILLGLDQQYKTEVIEELLEDSGIDTSKIPEVESDVVAMRTKMSKSKADSAVSVHDGPEEIKNKIVKAYAPPKDTTSNPILNWTEHLVFYEDGSSFTLKRPEQYGGNKEYKSYEELENDYKSGDLSPQDLKNNLSDWLIEKLAPAREYFENPTRKAALEEIERLTAKP